MARPKRLARHIAVVATAAGLAMPSPAGAQPAAQATHHEVPVVPRPLIAVVSIGQQRVAIYDRGGLVDQSPISSGRRGFETPQGVFSIIEKKEEHYSNLYDDAAMPFMQRLTWSGVAFHAGQLPGYPASHGCIRLPARFAERFFRMSRLNMRVIVVPGAAAPVPIRHPSLFQPAAATVDPEAPPLQLEAGTTQRDLQMAGRAGGPSLGEAPMMLGLRPAEGLVLAPSPPERQPQPVMLTPMQHALARKQTLALKAAAAARARDASRLVHRARLSDLVRVERAIGTGERTVRLAGQRLAAAGRQIAQARTAEQMERANIAYLRIVEETETARWQLEERRRERQRLREEAQAAADAAVAAEREWKGAAAAARAADRLFEPVSVFVSRQTSKVYIRQGRHPVAEMPVTILERDKPIGTFVFTATGARDGGREVEWTAVVVAEPAGTAVASEAGGGRQGARSSSEPTPATAVPLSAVEALERITLPAEALTRIAPYVHPGSSLIVSDLGPSVETGPGTDFVVLTKGEEEARAFMVRYARENGLRAPRRE
jgi:hypothetical protein